MRLYGVFAFVVVLATVSCGLVSRDEVARLPSPDGRVEAVLIETNGGATTSFGYEVRVLEKNGDGGFEVATLYGALRSENAYGVNLKWGSNTELLIEYLRAKDARLKISTVRSAGRDIRVSLHSGITDSNAPTGGMLYNLERNAKAR